jgi:hypothetical protein
LLNDPVMVIWKLCPCMPEAGLTDAMDAGGFTVKVAELPLANVAPPVVLPETETK